MKQTASTRELIVMLGLALLGVMAYLNVTEARSAAERLRVARSDLSEVDQKLAEINRYQTAPRIAALDAESPDQIVNRIAAALQTAGLPQSSLVDQTSTEPTRIDRSDFKIRSVDIKLQPATITQILKVCDALRDDESGTRVRDLLLKEPSSGTARVASQSARRGNQEKWEARLTLTQMIYSPTSDESLSQ